MKQRIQKVLGHIASRRQIEAMVLQGRIVVNGQLATVLPVMVDPQTDRIDVDGERIKTRTPDDGQRLYFLLNKPKGVYCTNVAQGAQIRAIDLLPKGLGARVYPVGRLDADSKGLLILTNDGELTNQLTHPRYGILKTYHAVVEGDVSPEALAKFRAGGVWLADRRSGAYKSTATGARVLDRNPHRTVLEITIRESKNRQARRMLARLGHKVRELIRVRIGPLTLEELPPGRFRPLSEKEVRQLKRVAQEAMEKPKGAGAQAHRT
jgi:23S rRNA pseudouridine2605 synthase